MTLNTEGKINSFFLYSPSCLFGFVIAASSSIFSFNDQCVCVSLVPFSLFETPLKFIVQRNSLYVINFKRNVNSTISRVVMFNRDHRYMFIYIYIERMNIKVQSTIVNSRGDSWRTRTDGTALYFYSSTWYRYANYPGRETSARRRV